MTTIGIIGSGHVGSNLAQAAIAHGYDVPYPQPDPQTGPRRGPGRADGGDVRVHRRTGRVRGPDWSAPPGKIALVNEHAA